MRLLHLSALLLALTVCLGASAQGKKKRPVTKPATPVQPAVKSQAQLLFDNMLPNTQQVFVIDSMVVEKNNFLAEIPLPAESGRLMTYNEFFNTNDHEDSYVYVNGFGNKCFFSVADTTGTARIYTCDKLGDNWSAPQPLEGISQFSGQMNFPFMMSDGATLYFAAKGKESLGGYDIFVTRYDAEDGRFLRPENVGLPFNSSGNDFMYVEDDLDSLAWFVTDRNQPEGMVCVYTLVPSSSRQNYDLSDYSEAQLRQLAAIKSIRRTWPSIERRNAAMERLERLTGHSTRNASGGALAAFRFPINDDVVYTSADDFLSPTNADLFADIQDMRRQLKEKEEQTERLRVRYHQASGTERTMLADDIREAEKTMQRIDFDIRKLEKTIRNKENRLLTK